MNLKNLFLYAVLKTEVFRMVVLKYGMHYIFIQTVCIFICITSLSDYVKHHESMDVFISSILTMFHVVFALD